MQFPIFIGLRRSRFVDGIVLLVVLLATVTIIEFPGQAPTQLALIAASWALAGLTWHRLTPMVTTLRLERSGQIFIALRGISDFSLAIPRPNSTVHPWLTVLRLNTEDGSSLVVIATADSQNEEDFRRLRTFLRWQASFNVPSDDA